MVGTLTRLLRNGEMASINVTEKVERSRGVVSPRRRWSRAAGPVGISSPDRVVDTIVQGIRSGRYVPGQKLIEADLTHDLRVSRGPVREALKRLAAEGVVMLTRHRGAYIRALSRAEADETLVVLEVLTGLMARLAAETVNAGDHAERIRKAYEWLGVYKNGQASSNEYIEKRRHFYDTLVEIGGNEQLGRIMPTMQIHLLRLQVQPYLTRQGRQEQLRDYAEITEAVLAGKPQQAERAMRRHIRRARTRYRRLPDDAFWSQSGAG
jgi:DNA-binding GntR family transcriptional regulator